MSPGDGILVSGARSGAGKTVATIGLQRAFARTGLRVRGAKTGPDYLDPGFHAVATGRPSVNLDGFAMRPAMIAGLAADRATHADLVVAEGAMGLFDGPAGGDAASAAAVARLFGWPVLLVLDASGAAQTLAATALGAAAFPHAPRIAGVIANRVASARHRRMIEAGLSAVGLPLLGALPDDPRLALPSRHLGLVQAGESQDMAARIDAIADVIAGTCDLAAIRAAARPTVPAPLAAPLPPPGQHLAVARDAAFGFLYPHLLEGWRRAGAAIRFFSPLADEAPDPACDACWLPGGYPELHAGTLAASTGFLAGLRAFAATRPVHGECGGYMVLGETLEDADGTVNAMAGLLPVSTSFARRKLHLGYRRARWRNDTAVANAGEERLGHEFHYASVTASHGEPLVDLRDGEGNALPPAGHRVGNVTGSFFHLIA